MKKIFLVKRTDRWWYDEYDSCVIIAKDLEQVEYMLDEAVEDNRFFSDADNGLNDKQFLNYWDKGEREIIEINLDNCPNGLLLSSYNAG